MNPNNTILRLEGCVSRAVRGAAGFFLSRISWRQLNTLCATSPEWSLKWDYLVICLCPWYLLWLTREREREEKKNPNWWRHRKILEEDFWAAAKTKAKERVLRGVWRRISANPSCGSKTKQLVLSAQRQQQQRTITCALKDHMSVSAHRNKSLTQLHCLLSVSVACLHGTIMYAGRTNLLLSNSTFCGRWAWIYHPVLFLHGNAPAGLKNGLPAQRPKFHWALTGWCHIYCVKYNAMRCGY